MIILHLQSSPKTDCFSPVCGQGFLPFGPCRDSGFRARGGTSQKLQPYKMRSRRGPFRDSYVRDGPCIYLHWKGKIDMSDKDDAAIRLLDKWSTGMLAYGDCNSDTCGRHHSTKRMISILKVLDPEREKRISATKPSRTETLVLWLFGIFCLGSFTCLVYAIYSIAHDWPSPQ